MKNALLAALALVGGSLYLACGQSNTNENGSNGAALGCPTDRDLSTDLLPCSCYGMSLAAMPDCSGPVRCSTFQQGLHCQPMDIPPDAGSVLACPTEVNLATIPLPCVCFGETLTQLPACDGIVKCCPSKMIVECEPLPPDAGIEPDAAMPADAATTPSCPTEVDLSTVQLPCQCFNTTVTETVPACTGTRKCCGPAKRVECE